jgi:hypothetical protein
MTELVGKNLGAAIFVALMQGVPADAQVERLRRAQFTIAPGVGRPQSSIYVFPSPPRSRVSIPVFADPQNNEIDAVVFLLCNDCGLTRTIH